MFISAFNVVAYISRISLKHKQTSMYISIVGEYVCTIVCNHCTSAYAPQQSLPRRYVHMYIHGHNDRIIHHTDPETLFTTRIAVSFKGPLVRVNSAICVLVRQS